MPSAHRRASVGRRLAVSLANHAPMSSRSCTNNSAGQSRQRNDSRYGAGGPSIRTTMSRSEVSVRRGERMLPPRKAASATGNRAATSARASVTGSRSSGFILGMIASFWPGRPNQANPHPGTRRAPTTGPRRAPHPRQQHQLATDAARPGPCDSINVPATSREQHQNATDAVRSAPPAATRGHRCCPPPAPCPEVPGHHAPAPAQPGPATTAFTTSNPDPASCQRGPGRLYTVGARPATACVRPADRQS